MTSSGQRNISPALLAMGTLLRGILVTIVPTCCVGTILLERHTSLSAEG